VTRLVCGSSGREVCHPAISTSRAATMVKKVLIWCCFVVSLTAQTPDFKPLVPGVESALQWLPSSHQKSSQNGKEFLHYLEDVLYRWDNVNLTKGVTLKRIGEHEGLSYLEDPSVSLLDGLVMFLKQHVVQVKLMDLGPEISNELQETGRCKLLKRERVLVVARVKPQDGKVLNNRGCILYIMVIDKVDTN